MQKFLFAAAIAAAITLYAPTVTDAGEQQYPKVKTGPVRQFVANVVGRWKNRTAKVGRFACEVAATVRPVVTVSFAGERPSIELTYNLVPVAGTCANGKCVTAGK